MERGQEVQSRRQKSKEQQCVDDIGEGSCRWRKELEKQLGHCIMRAALLGTCD